MSIEVNGMLVWRNSSQESTLDKQWMDVDLDISAFADDNSAVQLSFKLNSNSSQQLGGWNLDGVEIYVVEAVPGSLNTITLSGPSSIPAGLLAGFLIDGAPSNSPWYLMASSTNTGLIFQGHAFDLGLPVRMIATGTTTGTGEATPVLRIPQSAAGWTGYLECAVLKAGQWYDSNLHTLAIH